MPPKKSRKQSNPRKSKGKTQAEKIIEEAIAVQPVVIVVDKSVTTRGRSRAQPRKSILKQNTSSVEEVKMVSNTPVDTKKRLHTLVKTSDKLTAHQPDQAPTLSNRHSSHVSSKHHSSRPSEGINSDTDSENSQQEVDVDPRIQRQKEQRRERYEKSNSGNAKGGSRPKKGSRSQSAAAAKKSGGNRSNGKAATNAAQAKEEVKQQSTSPTPVNIQKSAPQQSPSESSSRRVNRNKSVNKSGSLKSSGVKIKTKTQQQVPEVPQPEESKVTEEFPNESEIPIQLHHQLEEQKSSKALSQHSRKSHVENTVDLLEEVKQTLNDINHEEEQATKMIIDSKKSSRKGPTTSRKHQPIIDEALPLVTEENKMIVENVQQHIQSETQQDYTFLIDMPSNKSSRVSHSSIKENLERPEEPISAQAFAPSIVPNKKTNRKSELLPVPELPPKPEPLTEEEIRVKYQDNDHYNEWHPKHQYYKKQLDAAFKKGLPKIYPNDEEIESIENDHARVSQIRERIRDKLHEFKFSTTEPSGEDPANLDFDALLEDSEMQEALQKLIAFKIEGSSLNLNELKKLCYSYLVTEHLQDLSSLLNEFQVDLLISNCALRKCYGAKPKLAVLNSDKTPLALWCWEISNLSLLDPVSEAQIKKARAQRLIVAKKIQQLHAFLEMCEDHTTYDSIEKVAKLNEEFQAFSRLGQKETTTEWVIRKRKHQEVDEKAGSKGGLPRASVGAAKKVIKPNSYEEGQYEIQPVSEITEVNIDANGAKAQIVPPLIKESAGTIKKFFQRVEKPAGTENTSSMVLKTQDELKRNPHVQYAAVCQTEALKIQKAWCGDVNQSWFDTPNILDRFKVIKDFCEANLPSPYPPPRPKNIQMHDSAMHYSNVIFDKQSRILNCRKPFEKDPTMIDYEQESDEEWEELHGENLEDDDLLDEENMEVVEDEADQVSLPSAGVSHQIKQRLAFRSQYCQRTNQFMNDAEELIQEGFVVPDDYVSEDSSEEMDQSKNKDRNTRMLLQQAQERFNNKLKNIKAPMPYILLPSRLDLGDYKAVSLLRKKIKPVSMMSRVSFSNLTSEGEATTASSTIVEFPLSVEKSKKPEETTLRIKDVVNELVLQAHATSLSKKQLVEDFKMRFNELKKSHIDAFVKECFDKKKQPLDSKVRLFAQAEALEKYGASESLLQELPRIYESKKENERLAAAEAQANIQRQSEEDPSVLMPAPSIPPKSRHSQISRPRTSSNRVSKHTVKDQEVSIQPRLSEVHVLQPEVSQRLSNVALAGGSSNSEVIIEENLQSFKSSSHQAIIEDSKDNNIADSDVVMQEDVVMESVDENSWNQQPPAVFVETPAFNSKLFDLPSTDHKLDQSSLDHINEEPQLSLSQHAIVLPYNAEEGLEPEQIHIGNQNFNRSVQQYQSTPIQNFRTLRSREISVDHSQNANVADELQQRQRSDSMETDKGNPLQNQAPVTDQEDLILLNQDIEHHQPHTYIVGSPPSHAYQLHHLNLTKSNFEHLNHLIGEVAAVAILPQPHEEDAKDEPPTLHDMRHNGSFGAVPLYTSSNHLEEEEEKAVAPLDITFAAAATDNQMTASKHQMADAHHSFVDIQEGADEGEQQPRRSKRLESRHNNLIMQTTMSQGGFHQDDELNHAYSQDGNVRQSKVRTPRRSQSKSRSGYGGFY